jgi:integrase
VTFPRFDGLRVRETGGRSIEFLGWLDARGQTLASCTQHDIDTWYASGPGTREHVERFLYWCRTQRLTSKLDVPQRDKDDPELIGESERLTIIRALLLHDTLPLPYRIAGCLITLYGQSASRVARLGINDVDADSGEVQLRLGREWLPVPEPLSILLATHLRNRSNINTAANATTSWLFPGRMPNQPIHPQTLLDVLRASGVPVRAARNTTWQQLVREAPPLRRVESLEQVLANSLGVSPTTAMQHADRAGSDWTRYAATIQASPKNP